MLYYLVSVYYIAIIVPNKGASQRNGGGRYVPVVVASQPMFSNQ